MVYVLMIGFFLGMMSCLFLFVYKFHQDYGMTYGELQSMIKNIKSENNDLAQRNKTLQQMFDKTRQKLVKKIVAKLISNKTKVKKNKAKKVGYELEDLSRELIRMGEQGLKLTVSKKSGSLALKEGSSNSLLASGEVDDLTLFPLSKEIAHSEPNFDLPDELILLNEDDVQHVPNVQLLFAGTQRQY